MDFFPTWRVIDPGCVTGLWHVCYSAGARAAVYSNALTVAALNRDVWIWKLSVLCPRNVILKWLDIQFKIAHRLFLQPWTLGQLFSWSRKQQHPDHNLLCQHDVHPRDCPLTMTLCTYTMFVWIYTSKQAFCCVIVIGPKAEVLFITCWTLPGSSCPVPSWVQ